MLVSTNEFLTALELWARAIRADDFKDARKHAGKLAAAGAALAKRPEFAAVFRGQDTGCDAEEALQHMAALLLCVTDGRAAVLKTWLAEHGPKKV